MSEIYPEHPELSLDPEEFGPPSPEAITSVSELVLERAQRLRQAVGQKAELQADQVRVLVSEHLMTVVMDQATSPGLVEEAAVYQTTTDPAATEGALADPADRSDPEATAAVDPAQDIAATDSDRLSSTVWLISTEGQILQQDPNPYNRRSPIVTLLYGSPNTSDEASAQPAKPLVGYQADAAYASLQQLARALAQVQQPTGVGLFD